MLMHHVWGSEWELEEAVDGGVISFKDPVMWDCESMTSANTFQVFNRMTDDEGDFRSKNAHNFGQLMALNIIFLEKD